MGRLHTKPRSGGGHIVYTDLWACARPKGKYKGIYPGGMVERLLELVPLPPDGMMLHQFGGSVQPNGKEHTVDLKPDLNPTYLTDARILENVPDNTYDIVIADPPYDSLNIEYGPKLYKTEPVRPYSFVDAGVRVTKPGGYFVILHQLIYKNLEGCKRFGVIGITTGPNMRIRCLNVFVKGDDPKFKQSSFNWMVNESK